jgi:hypothetical protein
MCHRLLDADIALLNPHKSIDLTMMLPPYFAVLGCAAFVVTTRNRPSTVLSSALDDNNEKKPQSRLARLAEDWLEEEEDELQLYWERFDEKTKEEEPPPATIDDDDESLTTEQRLERYYDRRGINKRCEQGHAQEIKEALDKAQLAATPEQAIAFLEQGQPWLQINSKLGGTALLELAIALWQRDEIPDEALCQELLGNLHVRRQVQQLLKNDGPPKRRSESSLWQGLLFDNQNTWWN